MGGQIDLLGEFHEDEEDKIVRIAWEGVKERGYAIYHDYDEYMEQRMGKSRSSLSGYCVQQIEETIRKTLKRETLKREKWVFRMSHGQRRFYPPGTKFPQLMELI